MTECVQCELELNKHRERMENYSRSSVEVLLLLYSSFIPTRPQCFIVVDCLVSSSGNVLGNSGLNRILILIRDHINNLTVIITLAEMCANALIFSSASAQFDSVCTCSQTTVIPVPPAAIQILQFILHFIY